jgi:hypothetical protein
MTNGEIFTQILHEVTGRPKAEVATLINHMKDRFPGKTRFDEELSPNESEQLLAALRQEKAGILNWVLEGAREAISHEG